MMRGKRNARRAWEERKSEKALLAEECWLEYSDKRGLVLQTQLREWRQGIGQVPVGAAKPVVELSMWFLLNDSLPSRVTWCEYLALSDLGAIAQTSKKSRVFFHQQHQHYEARVLEAPNNRQTILGRPSRRDGPVGGVSPELHCYLDLHLLKTNGYCLARLSREDIAQLGDKGLLHIVDVCNSNRVFLVMEGLVEEIAYEQATIPTPPEPVVIKRRELYGAKNGSTNDTVHQSDNVATVKDTEGSGSASNVSLPHGARQPQDEVANSSEGGSSTSGTQKMSVCGTEGSGSVASGRPRRGASHSEVEVASNSEGGSSTSGTQKRTLRDIEGNSKPRGGASHSELEVASTSEGGSSTGGIQKRTVREGERRSSRFQAPPVTPVVEEAVTAPANKRARKQAVPLEVPHLSSALALQRWLDDNRSKKAELSNNSQDRHVVLGDYHIMTSLTHVRSGTGNSRGVFILKEAKDQMDDLEWLAEHPVLSTLLPRSDYGGLLKIGEEIGKDVTQFGPYTFGGAGVTAAPHRAMTKRQQGTSVQADFSGSTSHLDGMGTFSASGGIKVGKKHITAVSAEDSVRAIHLAGFNLHAKPGGSLHAKNPPLTPEIRSKWDAQGVRYGSFTIQAGDAYLIPAGILHEFMNATHVLSIAWNLLPHKDGCADALVVLKESKKEILRMYPAQPGRAEMLLDHAPEDAILARLNEIRIANGADPIVDEPAEEEEPEEEEPKAGKKAAKVPAVGERRSTRLNKTDEKVAK